MIRQEVLGFRQNIPGPFQKLTNRRFVRLDLRYFVFACIFQERLISAAANQLNNQQSGKAHRLKLSRRIFFNWRIFANTNARDHDRWVIGINGRCINFTLLNAVKANLGANRKTGNAFSKNDVIFVKLALV